MAITTVRPNNSANTSFAVTGAATLHDAVNSPDSDSDYIYSTAGTDGIGLCTLSFPAPSLPSADFLKELRVRVRCKFSGTFRNCKIFGQSLADRFFGSLFATTFELGRVPVFAAPAATLNLGTQNLNTAGSEFQVIEVYLDWVHVPKPTVTVDSPSGTVTTTNLPTIAWTVGADGDGGYPVAFEVKVFDNATYGGAGFNVETSTPVAQSGIQGIAGSWAVGDEADESLPNDTYKAYVRVAQSINGEAWWSEWTAGAAFTIDAPLPAEPTIDVFPDDDNARLAVNVEDPLTGEVSTDQMEVQRSIDGGVTWVAVRTTAGDGLVDPFTPGPSGFKQAIIDLGPSLYWALDAEDGATDLSGNSHNGTGQGGVTIGGAAGLTAIDGDTATDFDGADDYITSTYAPFVAGTVRSFIALVNRDAHAGLDTILGGSGTAPPALYFAADSPATAKFWTGNEEKQWSSGVVDSDPVPVALIFDGTAGLGSCEGELFVNGTSVGVVGGAGAWAGFTTPGNFQDGAKGAGTDPFDGKIGHVAVFERALAPDEIAAIAALATGGGYF